MGVNSKLLEKDNSVKHLLKSGRWRARRMLTAARWGSEELGNTPAVFGNAMPKSGSHLISQVLQGLPAIGPFVNSGFPPVNRTESNQQLTDRAILERLSQMLPGDIGYGYLGANKIFIEALHRPGIGSIFVYRDPRDMIISHVFYATEMHEDHGMHWYYTENLNTMEERINAAIIGVNEDGVKLKGVRARYEGYMGWIQQSDILCLRFEDIRLDQEKTFGQILDYLEKKGFHPETDRRQAVKMLGHAIQPKKSGTFRKGKLGDWREYFTRSNIDCFKEYTGDLLIDLGYEADNDW